MVIDKPCTTECTGNQRSLLVVWVNPKPVRILHFLTSFLSNLYHRTSLLSTRKEAGRLLPIAKARGIRRPIFDEENGRIILQRGCRACLKCRSAEHLKELKPGFYLCDACIQELK